MVGIGALPLRMRDEHLHEEAGLRIVFQPKVMHALCRGMVWDLFPCLGARPREGERRCLWSPRLIPLRDPAGIDFWRPEVGS